MDDTLLTKQSSFPYFALIALENGGVLRLLMLLLASPLTRLLYYFVFESVVIRVLIFATFVDTRVSKIKSMAKLGNSPEILLLRLAPRHMAGFLVMWKMVHFNNQPKNHGGAILEIIFGS